MLSSIGIITLTSCYTTSISDPGTASEWGGIRGGSNKLYDGELHTYDVLGLKSGENVTEADIQRALGRSGSAVRPTSGSKILLVQSGAAMPDAALRSAMARHYQVQPFSGIPLTSKKSDVGSANSKQLRLAAAQAGARYVVAVWGTLETAEGDLASQTVSWVPIGGKLIPDQQKATRINLKAVVVDVASGKWSSVAAEPLIRKHVSAQLNRSAAWARQVEELKAAGYPKLAAAVARG